MAQNTTVNDQITDSVTQANVKVLGEAPAMAMGNLYQIHSQSMGLSMENAVSHQQSSNAMAQVITTQCVSKLLNIRKHAQ